MMKVETVDTRHGTLNKSGYSNGNTLPYTGTPFGMNYFIVQSQTGSSWHFDPTYPITQGFRLTHQPSPWMGDYSWLLFTPISGRPVSNDLNRLQSSYKESEAVFNPHQLIVESLRYRVKTTIVPTKRGAKFKLDYETDKEKGLLLTANESVTYEVDKKNNRLYGCVPQPVNDGKNTLNMYVVLDFDESDLDGIELKHIHDKNWKESSDVKDSFVWLSLATEQKNLTFSLGTSFISREQAVLNLKREVTPYTLEELTDQSAQEWEKHLNKVTVKDKNRQKVDSFNQYMYRLFLFPQTYYERDEQNQAIHFDSYSETVKEGKLFTNNGFWDTYRTVYPLFSIIYPEMYKDILEGIKHFYLESGHLPKWLSPDERGLMPGTLINAVISDAIVKDILPKEEAELFLDAMIKEATEAPKERKFGRAGVKEMLELGYVSNKEIENVNQTQDNAYSDFCIMQAAKKLGRHDVEERYRKEAENYRHLFDKNTGFLRGKDSKGEFADSFTPEDWGFDYTEGSAWQNALAFYHDNQGYIDLLGGKEKFIDHLTTLANEKPVFEIGNYGMEIHEMSEMSTVDFGQIAISNQPSFHIPYLYAYAGKPEYTQHVVKQLSTHAFKDGFDGFPGDEDNGSMSGWYIFSHLGFYPVTPGVPEYVLGIPQFDEMTIRIDNGQSFTIHVDGNVPQNSFVHSIELNGEAYENLFISHEDIIKGGEMTVRLSLLPNTKEYSVDQLPYSLSNDK